MLKEMLYQQRENMVETLENHQSGYKKGLVRVADRFRIIGRLVCEDGQE
jgi:hypothetical protein